MAEIDQFSHLIGKVYDAALNPGLWPEVLREAAEFVGGSGSLLYTKNVISDAGALRYSWGLDPTFQQSYFDHYVRIDPLTFNQFMFDVEEIYSVSDCIPYSELTATRFFKEWARPAGRVDLIAATLDKSATSFALLGISRGEREGLVDDGARRRMQLLVPHARRAVLIGNVIDLREGEAASLTETLNGLSSGVFLVDAAAKIAFANAAGDALLKDARMFRSEHGTLRAVDPQADRMLRGVFSSAPAGDAAVGVGGVAVKLSASPAERWLAHVLPLRSGARRVAELRHSTVAAVFVTPASIDTPSSLQTVAKLYDLTRTEIRVLGAVAEVRGIPAVAEVLGVSEATVKTHLQHLFAKTGMRRQTDLVKLIAGHVSPLAS